ncbi:MAG: NTP transferase domain-containing protein [Vulcanimicrobiaceae bacterium]
MIVVIPAGGRVAGSLAARIGSPFKALASIGGTTLVERAVGAARACGAGEVVVIGGREVRLRIAAQVGRVLDDEEDGAENLRRALALGSQAALLVLASDLPYIDGAALAAFVASASVAQADLAIPLAEAAAYRSRFPGAPPHATRLRDGAFANGSALYLARGVAPRVETLALDFFRARKSLVRMATLLGPRLLVRFVTRHLAVADIERRAARDYGIRARAIRGASPTLCFDVDGTADYDYALAHPP